FQVSKGDRTMIEVSEAEAAALEEQAKMASSEGLTRILEVLAEAEMRLRDAASKKILVEIALLRAIEARNAQSLDSVLKQLQGLPEGGSAATVQSPAVVPAPAAAARPARAEPQPVAVSVPPAPVSAPVAVAAPSADLQSFWARVVDAVGRASPFTR